ncbi:MAG: phage holin family protein [Chloroflexota bacterium]|jgi:putative membrane protein|nr:phage holin family protein [Chloroflexota bacterium]MDH5243069.1 phage holin family protein [Chloroflexota bacterium]
MSFILGTIATAITFAVVSYVLPQIDYGDELSNLLIVAVIAGVINGLIKPIVQIFSLPLTILTLGLFGFIINAALLLLLAFVTDLVGLTFTVGGFPPDLGLEAITAAFMGGIVITIVGSIVGLVVPD